jgi:hypothetical protein
MKVSKDTLHILKSFSSINPVIYLGDDKAVTVISPSKDNIGVFQAPEVFDHTCVFWEWPTLLSTIDSMGGSDAELSFEDKFLKIVSPDKSAIKYFYTPEIVVAQSNPRPKPFASYCKEHDIDFEVEVSAEVLAKMTKISRIMNLSKIEITMEDGAGFMRAADDSGKVSHDFQQEIEGKGTGKISLYLSSMNLIPGSYLLQVKSGVFSKWTNKDIPLFYIIAAKK